jgi:hypothetical protein
MDGEHLAARASRPNLRPATGPASCGDCFMFESLDEFRRLVATLGWDSPVVQAYGYSEAYLEADGICGVTGDPPVSRTEVCDVFSAQS